MRVKNVEPGLTATELGAAMQHEPSKTALETMHETLDPLDPADIADAIVFAVAAPANVNIADVVVVPVRQG